MFSRQQSKNQRFIQSNVTTENRSVRGEPNDQNNDIMIPRILVIPEQIPTTFLKYSSYELDRFDNYAVDNSSDSSLKEDNQSKAEVTAITYQEKTGRQYSSLIQENLEEPAASILPARLTSNGPKKKRFLNANRCGIRLFKIFAVATGLILFGTFLASIILIQVLQTTISTSSTTSTTSTTTTTSSTTSSSSSTSTTTTSTSTTTTSTSTTTSSTTSSSSSTSTTTTSTSTTTTTTSSLLPAQCFSYVTNNDSTRNVNYNGTIACDSTVFGNGTWVRFVSPAGTQLPTTAPTVYCCGTHATGWFTGSYPTVAGNTISGTVCYNWNGNTCNWSNSIQVTNCITFYVFFLINTSACSLRYCTV